LADDQGIALSKAVGGRRNRRGQIVDI